ncbi:hypothetical protein HJ526_00985 [Donghicola sp. C2-DW-16]|uniref:Flagellar biosynthesis protein n=1 Tax=Donghicola mangrovi TaxID=2729614 RepID=A0ABX2PA55_9RHOB|nr:hypothetical protein [Donghicola mangrovi]NVO25981.1 hypothetical protein [Donghicola mangrovi]
MSIESLLMDFGPSPVIEEIPEQATGLNLDSFEEGYNAGWADAVKANKDEQADHRAKVAESLKDFAFSRTEMQQQILRELRPLIEGVLTAILPNALRPALAPMVVETLEAMASDTLSNAIKLAVPEGMASDVDHLLDRDNWPDLTVIEDPSLGTGRAEIRFGDTTKIIDLDAVQDQISRLVSDFFNAPQTIGATGTEG